MFLEDSQIFHPQFLKIEDYIQNFCHNFHIHNFYEPYTELTSEKFIFIIYSYIFHSQSWKTACFPALGQENRFSDLQTMNFFFSAWNENSTKSYFFVFFQLLLFPCHKTLVLRFFSINSKVILKNSRPTAENFSILLENLLKKIEIQVFFDTEATKVRRNKKIRLWQKGT